jgi:hypothetical protein
MVSAINVLNILILLLMAGAAVLGVSALVEKRHVRRHGRRERRVRTPA